MSNFNTTTISEMNEAVMKFCMAADNLDRTQENAGNKKQERTANCVPVVFENTTNKKRKLNASGMKFPKFELPDVIYKGERETVLFKYACSLRAKGISESEIRSSVHEANDELCETPLSGSEIENQVLASAFQYQQGTPATDIGIVVPKGKSLEYVYLSDDAMVIDALDGLGVYYFKLWKGVNIEISTNEDKIRYVLCGRPDFNKSIREKLDELGADYSLVVGMAFHDRKLLDEKKSNILWTKLQQYIEIDEADENAFIFQDIVLYAKDSCYHIKNEKNDRCISNFIIKIVDRVDNVNDVGIVVGSDYTMDFVMADGNTITKRVQSSVFASGTQFKKFLKSDSIMLSYIGTDAELEIIQMRIHSQSGYIEKKIGLDHTGLYKHNGRYVYVGMNKAFYSGGVICDGVISTAKDSGMIFSNLEDKECISKENLEELLKVLFGFNTQNVSVPIVAWCISMMFRERLRAIGFKTPFLMLVGQAGSGKSSVGESIVSEFFSIKSAPLACDKLTQFSSIAALSGSNVIPTILEEYKPNRLGSKLNQLSAILRSSYDFQSIRRGTPNLQVIEYVYRSSICLIGESSTEETALKERSIETTVSLFTRTKEHTDNFMKLKNHPEWLQALGRSVLEKALVIKDDEIKSMLEENLNYFQTTTEFSSRNKVGLAVLLFGMRVLKQITEELGLDFSALTGIAGNEIATAVVGNMNSGMGDGSGGRAKSEVEKTIEIFSVMASKGLLKEGIHYAVNKTSNEVQLYLKEIFPEYSKYYRDYNLSDDIDYLSKNSFAKQLKQTEYYKTFDKRVFTYNPGYVPIITSSPKVFVLHRDKVLDNLEIDNF